MQSFGHGEGCQGVLAPVPEIDRDLDLRQVEAPGSTQQDQFVQETLDPLAIGLDQLSVDLPTEFWPLGDVPIRRTELFRHTIEVGLRL